MRVAVVALLLFLSNAAFAAPPIEIKIGFILPLSGDWSFLGAGVRDGALLAAEDLEDDTSSVKLVFEDNRGDLKQSAVAVHKLLSSDKVDAVVSIFSGVALLIRPIAEKAKVPSIGICSNLEAANGPFGFVNYITAAEGAAAYVEELTRRNPNGVNLGIFSMNEEGFNRIVQEVETAVVNKRVTITALERFEPKTTDFRSLISRAFTKPIDNLLILGLSPDIELLADQLKQLKRSVPMSSIEAFGLAERKSAFEGSWFVDAAAPTADFEQRFRRQFGREVTSGAAHSYATVQLLTQTARGVPRNVRSPERLASTLQEAQRLKTVVGEVTVDSEGIIHSKPSVRRIEQGRVLTISPP